MSFSILDNLTIKDSESLKKISDKLVYDIIFSEQESCTSPHVLICEANLEELKYVGDEIKRSFENLPEKFKNNEVSMFQASKIIKTRSEYAFENKDVLVPKGNNYTIFIDDNLSLEEPLGCRTLFIKSCKDLEDVGSLITENIQSIGYSIKDKEKLIKVGKLLNLKGVSRIIPIGQMNNYDQPWDGKLLLSRLVNINSLKLK